MRAARRRDAVIANSSLNELLLVVDLLVELVVVSNKVATSEWQNRVGIARHLGLDLGRKLVPLLVERLAVLVVLLHGEVLLVTRAHLERLVKGDRIDFLEDSLERDQGLLENLVPVILSQINDDGNQHGERLLLICLQDVEEVVVLEEAHSSVGDLQVDTTDALDDSLEEARDQDLNLIDFANL